MRMRAATGLLTEAADAGLLGHPHLVLARALGELGGASVPTTWISSLSMAMVGLSANQVAGTRPANQAPISRSCSGPDGGGLAERRLPRWAPLPLSLLLSHITRLHDYSKSSGTAAVTSSSI